MAGPSARPSPWAVIGKLVATLVAAGVLTAGLLLPYVGGLGLAARHEAEKFLSTDCNLQETQPPQKTRLYARDAKTLIATLFTQDRQPVPLSQIPTYLQQALVATEDRRFYSHHGVDMRGLLRSAVSTTSGDTQGGSTLTMQYVKQIRYYQAGDNLKKQQAAIDQNLNRKIEDAKCALYIENNEHESKDAILDNYLNIAFFGENSYGIETAALTYFDKHASQLTLPESALLVGLLRAPTQYDPFVNPDEARKRRNEVLQNLVNNGQLSQVDADKYAKTPVSLATTKPPQVREGCANAPTTVTNVAFFCEYAVGWLIRNGITATQLETGGLKIVTTLDSRVQNSMQSQLAKAIPASSPMTAVLPTIDPRTGDILAMATSKRYGTNTSKKDRTHTSLPIFTAYTGQGASTYKLFPLLTALSTGVPDDWALQTPPTSKGYVPNNCTTRSAATNGDANEFYSANETLTSATVKSSNTYFVGLADQLLNCDLQPVVDIATKLGMKGLQQPGDEKRLTIAQTIVNEQRAQQLVLGDVGTSPLELAGAYAGIADGGRYNAPAPILAITSSAGQALPVKRSPGVQVVSPQVALQAIKILTGDTKFPGTSAQPFQSWYSVNDSRVAGKTGTSVAVNSRGRDTSKNASLWFVGMTPDLVAAAALVNFDHPNAEAAGLPGVKDPGTNAYGEYASGIWLDALKPALTKRHWTWQDPSTVAGAGVPDVTGMSLNQAQRTLALAGFKMAQLDKTNGLSCASSEQIGTIAYFGPKKAVQGTTITVCPSNGAPQIVYVPPPPPPPPTKTKTKTKTKTATTGPATPPSRPRTSPGHGRHT